VKATHLLFLSARTNIEEPSSPKIAKNTGVHPEKLQKKAEHEVN
jgi:hypothetical protein